MSGNIEISENKHWIVAGWVFDNVIEETLPYIPKQDNAKLLLAIRSGFGEGKLEFIRLNKVPPRQKEVLLRALQEALRLREARGGEDFNDPRFYAGYIERFRELIEMLASEVSEARGKKNMHT